MRQEAYDEKKLAELILYIALRCEADPTFGAVKLNKLLFLADFKAYLSLGHPITGAEYQKLEHGPAPRRLVPVRQNLIKTCRAHLRIEGPIGFEQDKLLALESPDLSKFAAEEIAIVDSAIQMLWGKTAKEVSDLSHRFRGWQLAKHGETIPYETAFVPEEPLPISDEDREWAQESIEKLSAHPD